MADASEPVDKRKEIEESVKPKCTAQLKQYEACAERIKSDTTGSKHCTGWYFDYWKCIDKYAQPKIFATTR